MQAETRLNSAIFRPQWCQWFHSTMVTGQQRCPRFHLRRSAASKGVLGFAQHTPAPALTRPQKDGIQNGAGDHSPAPSVKSARRSGAHGALVVLHQVDAALVALVAAEGGLQERVDEGESLFLSVLTGTDGHDVRVVVLAG